MLLKARNRWEAFAIHLLVSLVLFVVLAAVIYLWYPGVLFLHDGGLEGMKLIASVDFLIGPFLTLMVYKLGKKSLPFDLAVIALLQVACLVGGMWTVWQTRPVAVVYADGVFRSIPVQTFRDYGIDVRQIDTLRGSWPVWVAVKMPEETLAEWRRRVPIAGMVDPQLYFQTDYYVPFSSATADVLAMGKSRQQIRNFPTHADAETISTEGRLIYRAGFGSGSGFVLLDGSTAEAVDFVLDMPREKSLSTRLEMTKVKLVEFVDRLVQ